MEQIIFQGRIGDIEVERVDRNVEFTMDSKHFHNQYEIYYLVEGERYYFIDKETYLVKKGGLVFVDRNQIHKTGPAKEAYHDRVLISFSGEEIESFSNTNYNINIENFFKRHNGVLEFNEDGQKHVENLIFKIMDEMQKRMTGYEFVIKARLVELIIFAIRCIKGENTTRKTNTAQTEKHKKVHEIAEFINENYQKQISLTQISEDFYISKSYLSRIFKEVTGFTVHEYLNIVRIKKAQYLLENTDISITSVAEKVGYDSITYFERVFKKYFEIAPLRYRKKYQQPKFIG